MAGEYESPNLPLAGRGKLPSARSARPRATFHDTAGHTEGTNPMKAAALIPLRSVWTVTCTIAVLAGSIHITKAQMMLIDDFNDGNDEGWTHIDSNDGQPWGPGSFDASSGAYHLSTPGIVPTSASCRGCMLSWWDQSSDPFYSDGLIRAKVRVDQHDSAAVLFFRASGDLTNGINGYTFHGIGGGGFNSQTIVSTQVIGGHGIDGLTFGVGEDWWIEGGAVGDDFSMKVWRDGQPEPTQPQLVYTDSTFSSGQLAVDANISFTGPTEAAVNSTFDDIYFTPNSTLAGDYNIDNYVNGLDFLSWQRGQSPKPLSSSDLVQWQENYGAASSLVTARAVPEPSSLGLLCFALATFMRSKL